MNPLLCRTQGMLNTPFLNKTFHNIVVRREHPRRRVESSDERRDGITPKLHNFILLGDYRVLIFIQILESSSQKSCSYQMLIDVQKTS